jgi:D-alanyl-D-alanine carboxypeptidase/D-alanyl-D-alanine-endopeptidase (penicillin-binding protein 4)
VAALSVNYGAFSVQVAAGEVAGAPLRIAIDPPTPFLRLANQGRTGPARASDALVVERRAAGEVEEVVVRGALAAGSAPVVLARSVLDPVAYAGAVLRMQLEALGIRVEGAALRGSVPAQAALLLRFEGRPLAEIAQLCLKYSNNAIAEGLVKALAERAARAPGVPASWPAGVAALRGELLGLGLSLEGMTLVDGSGLSYENRVAPRAFVDALRAAARSFRFGPEFVAALPIAAADGTLEERAAGAAHAARAKTGLLTRVTGLSGYAERPDGGVAVFSVLANGWRGDAEAAMAGMDAFLAALVSP